MDLGIYVPVDKALKSVLHEKSALVGHEVIGDGVLIYYEGNIHNASNLTEFSQRLACAAGRLVENYPTVAKMMVRPEQVRAVGTYTTDGWRVIEVTDRPTLAEWLDGVDDPVFQV